LGLHRPGRRLCVGLRATFDDSLVNNFRELVGESPWQGLIHIGVGTLTPPCRSWQLDSSARESLLPGRFPISRAVQFYCCRALVTGFPTSGAVSPCRTCHPATGFPALGAVVYCPSLHIAAGFPTFGAARTGLGFHLPDDRLVQVSPPQARM